MRRYSSVITFVATFIILAAGARATLLFEENFDTLSNGNLVGQNNWIDLSLGTRYQVQDSLTYSGTRAMSVLSSTNTHRVYHSITPTENGSIFLWIRSNETTNQLAVWGMNGSNVAYNVKMNSDTAFIGSEAVGTVNITTYKADTWYNMTISWSNKTNYTVCINDTYCDAFGNKNAVSGPINRIAFDLGNLVDPSAINYVDEIAVYDTFTPSPPSAGIINITSPLNTTYHTNRIELNVTNSSPVVQWLYNIDNESINHTFTPNTTISLIPYGFGYHNITVYAWNITGNTTQSDTIGFSFEYVTVSDFLNITEAFETDVVYPWLDIHVWNWSAVNSIDMDLIWNGTPQNVTAGIGNNYSSAVTIPTISQEHTITAFWNYTVNYTFGYIHSVNSTQLVVDIKQINLTSCAAGNITMTIRGFNESQTNESVNFSAGVYVKIGLTSKEFNFSFSGDSSYDLCISPADEVYIADVDIEYSAPGTDIRYYYFRNIQLNNNTRFANLYLLDDYETEQIDFNIQDKNYKDQSNIVVKALRWYPGLAQYLVVAQGLTGDNGLTSMFLKRDVYYKWELAREGITLKTTTPETLTATSITEYIDVDERAAFFQYWGQVAYRCRVDDSAKTIICEYSDNSGKMLNMRLTAKQVLLYNRTAAFCTKTSTSSAGTLICPFDGYENDTILYDLRGYFTGSGYEWTALVTEFYNYVSGAARQAQLWGSALGTDGIIMAFGVILFCAALGMFRPNGIIVGTLLGVILVTVFQLVFLELGTIIGLIAASGFLLYKMRFG